MIADLDTLLTALYVELTVTADCPHGTGVASISHSISAVAGVDSSCC